MGNNSGYGFSVSDTTTAIALVGIYLLLKKPIDVVTDGVKGILDPLITADKAIINAPQAVVDAGKNLVNSAVNAVTDLSKNLTRTEPVPTKAGIDLVTNTFGLNPYPLYTSSAAPYPVAQNVDGSVKMSDGTTATSQVTATQASTQDIRLVFPGQSVPLDLSFKGTYVITDEPKPVIGGLVDSQGNAIVRTSGTNLPEGTVLPGFDRDAEARINTGYNNAFIDYMGRTQYRYSVNGQSYASLTPVRPDGTPY